MHYLEQSMFVTCAAVPTILFRHTALFFTFHGCILVFLLHVHLAYNSSNLTFILNKTIFKHNGHQSNTEKAGSIPQL